MSVSVNTVGSFILGRSAELSLLETRTGTRVASVEHKR